MFYRENFLAIREAIDSDTYIIESIINENADPEIITEGIKDIGNAIVNFFKKLGGWIVDICDVASKYVSETFNKGYMAFKKYKYLAGVNIDFDIQSDKEVTIEKVSKVQTTVLAAAMGNINFNNIPGLDAILGKVANKVTSESASYLLEEDYDPDNDPDFAGYGKRVINTPLGEIDVDVVRENINDAIGAAASMFAKVFPGGAQNELQNMLKEGNPSKYIQSLIQRAAINSRGGDLGKGLEKHAIGNISNVCSSAGEVKTMLEYLSNRRPVTVMTAAKVASQRAIKKYITQVNAYVSKGRIGSKVSALIMKFYNTMKNAINTTYQTAVQTHRMVCKDFITILSVIHSKNKGSKKDSKTEWEKEGMYGVENKAVKNLTGTHHYRQKA